METDAATAASLQEGDVVARTHTNANFPSFLYYLMQVTKRATELTADRTCEYGKHFPAGSIVIEGHLFEPNDGEFGEGPGFFDDTQTALMFADEIITDPHTNQPKVVLLDRQLDDDGEVEGYVYLDSDTHDSILSAFGGRSS